MGLANLVGQVLDEKYRIEKQLGKGGMGAVYFATHLGTDRPVAVKVIVPQFMAHDEFVERFRREAKAAGRLRHPNVVDVTDFGFAPVGRDRVAYLVMEYLDGCALAEVLAEDSRLPLAWALDVLEQACSAVDEAHQQGIIHRDLKPDNIWLEPNRRGGYTVKVLDFGLAKLGDTAMPQLPDAIPLMAATPSGGSSVSAAPSSARTIPPSASETQPTGSRTVELPEAELHESALHESATLLQPAPAGEEEVTRIFVDPSPGRDPRYGDQAGQPEAATQLLPPDSTEDQTLMQPAAVVEKDETRMLGHTTVEEQRARETAPADGLTRVGSILGTPIYMSPEQCRSEGLTARSDIYSLGVIAYQMLAGEPPFKGQMHEVMRQHMETPPPPLREKNGKVPKKVARVVMFALAKDPAERPASAAGFASSLRASAEGTGALLRRAFALYSEHFPKFIRVSLLVYSPVLLLNIFQIINSVLMKQGQISRLTFKIFSVSLLVLTFCVTFFAAATIAGVTIRLVTQLFVAPLRPIELRLAFAALKRRLRPLLTTQLRVGVLSMVGLILFIVPGVIYYINASLAASVVLMEDLKGRAAVKRSKALVKRVRRTVIAIILIQYAIPAIASSLALSIIISFFKGMNPGQADVVGKITGALGTVGNVFIIPLIASMSALLYLKARLAGGETLREVLSQFEEEEMPRSQWQLRMRERLHTPTHHSSRP